MASTRSLIALLWLISTVWAQSPRRVVILGIDGLDHGIASDLMGRGELPELARLEREGTFARCDTTNPAQSPVAWSSMMTGEPPAVTGIRDFLVRGTEDGKIWPHNGLVRVQERGVMRGGVRFFTYVLIFLVALVPWWLWKRRRGLAICLGMGIMAFLLLLQKEIPESVLIPHNRRTTRAFFEELDEAGIPVTSLFAPCSFPAPDLNHGRLLAGLGVPDLLGTHGACCVYRGEPVPGGTRWTTMGSREVAMAPTADGNGWGGADLLGPKHPRGRENLRLKLAMQRARERYLLQVGKLELELEAGRATPLVPLQFEWSPIFPDLSGITRFRLMQGGDRPVLYQEPVQIDPRLQVPWAKITSSAEYGRQLARSGLFETVGWATATNPYQDELIDDEALLEDVALVRTRQESMVLETLKAEDWRVHFSVLSTPDRLQHVFFKDHDREHPGHDAEAAKRRGDVIAQAYRDADRFIGRIQREVLRETDVLLVVSDHGFAPFRYAVNLNRWLLEAGYLEGRPTVARDLQSHLGKAIDHVEWNKSRAYSLGLGQIWLNQVGREPQGIVPVSERAKLVEEIRQGLLALRHEGRPVVRSVSTRAELGERADDPDAPDLVVGFERGYRVSWASCLLGMDEALIVPNLSRWSGDHCSVDPELVPGLLASNVRLEAGKKSLLDIVPTLRASLGLAPKANQAGRSLWVGP